MLLTNTLGLHVQHIEVHICEHVSPYPSTDDNACMVCKHSLVIRQSTTLWVCIHLCYKKYEYRQCKEIKTVSFLTRKCSCIIGIGIFCRCSTSTKVLYFKRIAHVLQCALQVFGANSKIWAWKAHRRIS